MPETHSCAIRGGVQIGGADVRALAVGCMRPRNLLLACPSGYGWDPSRRFDDGASLFPITQFGCADTVRPRVGGGATAFTSSKRVAAIRGVGGRGAPARLPVTVLSPSQTFKDRALRARAEGAKPL